MAPDETSTTWLPPRVRAASASARAAIRSSSIPPRAVVSDDEPTLTTTGLAAAIPGHCVSAAPPRRRLAPHRVGPAARSPSLATPPLQPHTSLNLTSLAPWPTGS